MTVLIPVALGIPLATAFTVALAGNRDTLRIAASMTGSLGLAGAVMILLLQGGRQSWTLVETTPSIAFDIEPLGMLFACIAASLWPLNALYSIGYMGAAKEKNLTRFDICFAIALFGAIGVAFAANLYTLFIFYEILTISTYPLVAHKGNDAAKHGGRIYLGALLTSSLVLFLPAIVAIWNIAGTTDFIQGGILPDTTTPVIAGILLAMCIFGVGKAAVIPIHFWLPAAMVAPTPVSALLHAVAVVKAGVFVILKLAIYTFGPNLLADLPWRVPLLYVVVTGLVLSSVIALTRNNFKARLAWSTIGQLAYVTTGALLSNPAALAGSATQILAHAYGKITLFMCAGTVYVATGLTNVSQLRGLGRKMPWVFVAFTLGAASVCGLPPMAGLWPKFLLLQGAWIDQKPIVAIALLISSLLATIYLLGIAVSAFLPPASDSSTPPEISTPAPTLTVAPLLLTAAISVALFALIPYLNSQITDLVNPP